MIVLKVLELSHMCHIDTYAAVQSRILSSVADTAVSVGHFGCQAFWKHKNSRGRVPGNKVHYQEPWSVCHLCRDQWLSDEVGPMTKW